MYFFGGALDVTTVLIPLAIYVCLWRIFITNKSPRVMSLGLNNSTESCAPLISKRMSSPYLFLYFLISVSTFVLGVFVFRVFYLIEDLVDTWH